MAIYDTVFSSILFYRTHIRTYVYSAWSLIRVHLSSAIQLMQFALCIQSLLCMLFLKDSLYIRTIWLLVCLWNLWKPDMVPVSIYVEKNCLRLSLNNRHSPIIANVREGEIKTAQWVWRTVPRCVWSICAEDQEMLHYGMIASTYSHSPTTFIVE